MSLTLDQARGIVAAARTHGQESGFKPLTVVVLDAGGHVLAVEREDGSSTKRFEVAYGKAHGAVSLGMGSRAIFKRANEQPYFVDAINTMARGALVPVPGGVLIKDKAGNLLGAIGISGDTSDNDETAAIAGIEAAGLAANAG